MKALRPGWLLVLVLGCSSAPWPPPPPWLDGGDGGRVDAGRDAGLLDGGLPARSACATLTNLRCDYLARCGLVEPTVPALRACITYFDSTWCGPSLWPAWYEAGAVRYDSAMAAACADSLGRGTCAAYESLPPACEQFLLPASYLNQRCYGRYAECRDGVCRGLTCPRTCQAPGQKDDPCDEDQDCRPDGGLYCRSQSNTTGVGLCAPYGTLNEPCDVEQPCRADMFCSNQLRCEPKRAVGLPCLPGTCVAQAWCNPTLDGGYCAERRPVDQPCVDDVQCHLGLLCETISGRCAAPGPIPDGGACGARQQCGQGNICRGLTATQRGQCLPPLPHSLPCSAGHECEAHLACLESDGGLHCVERAAPGDSCSLDRDCQAFTLCVGGGCVPLPLPLEPCLRGRCLIGTCDLLPDAGNVCGGLGSPGDRCVHDIECVPGRCQSGRCLAACVP